MCVTTLSGTRATLDYCSPQLFEEQPDAHSAGRAPVVEAGCWIGALLWPMTCCLDPDTRMLIITGPNIGGKVDLYASDALIGLLAIIGKLWPPRPSNFTPWWNRIPLPYRLQRHLPAALDLYVEMSERQHPEQRNRCQPGTHG